jgi:endo-1,4-beta-xylanase
VAAKVDEAMGVFITGMVNHFKSKVRAWDVVNEPFTDFPVALRNNANTSTTPADVFVWSHYLGRDAALKAFNYAKAADPTADFYMNDYNLESNNAKLDSIIAFVAELRAKGAKIDGIGSQVHTSTTANLAGIDNMMRKLAATGLKVRVSELDVRTSPSGDNAKALAVDQPAMYKYIVRSYLTNVPAAQRGGITVWGINDKNSWLYNNGAELPLLYDDAYNKKPAYDAFLQALLGR